MTFNRMPAQLPFRSVHFEQRRRNACKQGSEQNHFLPVRTIGMTPVQYNTVSLWKAICKLSLEDTANLPPLLPCDRVRLTLGGICFFRQCANPIPTVCYQHSRRLARVGVIRQRQDLADGQPNSGRILHRPRAGGLIYANDSCKL